MSDDVMEQLPGLPARAFEKADTSPDTAFYRQPRYVAHIDEGAIAAVTSVYREVLPAGGAVLDMMSSWISHFPDDVEYVATGHGMNAAELRANTRLSRTFVQNLNADAVLPLGNGAFDAAAMCVSVQYLQQPVTVFREVRRVLRAGAPFVVSFSNRCFPTKAVAIWQALSGPEQQELVAAYMERAGFVRIEGRAHTPRGSDPLWVVIGRAGALAQA